MNRPTFSKITTQALETLTTNPPLASCECPECGGASTSAAPEFVGFRLICTACIQRREKQERLESLRRRFDECVRHGHVPDDLQYCSFRQSREDIERLNPEAWSHGRAWLRTGPKNLYLHGGVGVGKTHMARCCLYQAFVSGKSVAEVSCTRLTKTGVQFTEGGGLFAFWKRVEFLLIDDIGTDDWTVGRLRALWEVLDARTARRCRTLFTSNLDPAHLLQALRPGGTRAGCPDTALAISAMDRMKPTWKEQLTGASLR